MSSKLSLLSIPHLSEVPIASSRRGCSAQPLSLMASVPRLRQVRSAPSTPVGYIRPKRFSVTARNVCCGIKRSRSPKLPHALRVSPLNKQRRKSHEPMSPPSSFSFRCELLGLGDDMLRDRASIPKIRTPRQTPPFSVPDLQSESDSSDSGGASPPFQPISRIMVGQDLDLNFKQHTPAGPRVEGTPQGEPESTKKFSSINNALSLRSPSFVIPPLDFSGLKTPRTSHRVSDGSTDFQTTYRLLCKDGSHPRPHGDLVPIAVTLQGFIALTERQSDGRRFATKFYETSCVRNNVRLHWQSEAGEPPLIGRDRCRRTRERICEKYQHELRSHTTLSELATDAGKSFILKTYGHGTVDMYDREWHFLVLELGDSDLFDTIAEESPYDCLSKDKRAQLQKRMTQRAKQMYESVVFLHEHGYAHNDVSPENFIVNADGSVKLMDFGVTRHYTRFKKSSKFDVGKAKYLPSEVLRARALQEHCEYDPRTADSTALGNTLFTMFAGSNPLVMRGSTTEATVYEGINLVRKAGGLRALPGITCRLPEALLDLLENHVFVPAMERLLPAACLLHPFFSNEPLSNWVNNRANMGLIVGDGPECAPCRPINI